MLSLANFIKKDARDNSLAFRLELIGIPSLMFGSMMIAFLLSATPWVLVYSLFVMSAIILTFTSYVRGVIMHIVLNIFYLILNLIGLFNALL